VNGLATIYGNYRFPRKGQGMERGEIVQLGNLDENNEKHKTPTLDHIAPKLYPS
jgi:hypothetical protein